MTINPITPRQILTALESLEPNKWEVVLDFIGYLKYQTSQNDPPVHSQELTARTLLESELVGLWADRTDIEDSSSFARQLRQQAEQRPRV